MSEIDTIQLEKYELMLVFFMDLGEEAINKELEEIRQHLTSSGGEIFHEDKWGNRELSYSIKKQNQGFYIVLNFTYLPEKISELEKSLNINPGVIRYLLIKIPLNYSVKTLSEYQAEEEKVAKEAAARKAEETEKSSISQKKISKPGKIVKKEEIEEEKPEIRKIKEKEPMEAVKPVKKTKKPVDNSKSKLDEFDEKLKSIIDDPDITL